MAVIILKIELFLEIRKNVSSVEEKEPETTSLKSLQPLGSGVMAVLTCLRTGKQAQ